MGIPSLALLQGMCTFNNTVAIVMSGLGRRYSE